MKTENVKHLYDDYVLGTYAPLPLCIVRGKGSKVWGIDGKEYLDFFPGWAVSGLGHCHPAVMYAIKNQVKKVIHIPNNYFNIKQARLAEAISKHAFPAKTFFCNSGAEAVEAAIKFARKHGNKKGKHEIITMEKSFHGRTLAAVTATAQPKYHEGFEPLPQGFKYAVFNDFESLKKQVTKQTAAIMMEPVQGEGGINIADKGYLKAVRHLCDEQGILLIFDEVQTGMGRTGKMFAFQHFDVVPDLMTLAKSLGGGVPIGALVVNARVANVLVPGTHASTFGGNPLVTAAGLAVFDAIKKENLLENAVLMGAYLKQKLTELQSRYPVLEEIKGLGVMVGVRCKTECAEIVKKAFEKGLLINCTQGNVMRIMPAITVTKKLIDKAMILLEETLKEV